MDCSSVLVVYEEICTNLSFLCYHGGDMEIGVVVVYGEKKIF